MSLSHWFNFLTQGHIAQNNEGEKILFSIHGNDFELTWASGWFRLFKITEGSFGSTITKTMSGSDFYTLGRMCVHDMADDGMEYVAYEKVIR